MAVGAGGREAITEYTVLAAAGGYSLLALRPRTGRTHQIRVHLAFLDLPIAGDRRYGGGEGPGGLGRQFLHADRLRLERPTDGRWLHAWSQLPEDLAAALDRAGITAHGLPVGVGAVVEGEEGEGSAS
jgi:23S rRNA pseudouridine1911/1915/1917 synthase